jgi:hypothetical protein
MGGLFLLGVIGIWAGIVILMARGLARLFELGMVRNIVVTMASIVLLALPVADELISAPQFHKLCEEGTKLKFDSEKIRGRTIFLQENPQPEITVGLLNGYYIPWIYLDVSTKEILITSVSYYIQGGLFIRALGISETGAPLTIRGYCGPSEHPDQKNFLNRFDLKYIERKDIK